MATLPVVEVETAVRFQTCEEVLEWVTDREIATYAAMLGGRPGYGRFADRDIARQSQITNALVHSCARLPLRADVVARLNARLLMLENANRLRIETARTALHVEAVRARAFLSREGKA